MALYPVADYKKKYSKKGPAVPIYYPSQKFFPPVFLKIEIWSRKITESKNGPLNIIYLPLPENETFLSRLIEPDYSLGLTETGLLGELAIRNYDTIKSGLGNIINSDNTTQAIIDETKNVIKEAVDEGYSFIKTVLERATMDSESAFAKAVKQGLGYGFAPNKVMGFTGISISSQLPIQYFLSPKNIEEARTVEKIIKILAEASLPKLEEEALSQVLSPIMDVVSDLLPDEQFRGPYQQPNQSLNNVMSSFNRYIDNGMQGEDLETLKNSIMSKNLVNDVMSNVVEDSSQLFSSTFELPHFITLTVMKKIKGIETEAIELIRFPISFVIYQFDSERESDIGNRDAMSFIKYINESGEEEYFSTKYYVAMTMQEERVITSEDVVDYSRPEEIKERLSKNSIINSSPLGLPYR